jgi:hypothetical protein
MQLRAGTTIGTFTGVEETDVEIQPADKNQMIPKNVTQSDRVEVPEHLQELYEVAQKDCA